MDPRTEQVVAQCPVSGPADVDAAYDAALKAFESWRLTTPAERQMLLLRLADALEANADRLVEAQRRNTGQLAEMIRAEEVVTGPLSCGSSPGPPVSNRVSPRGSTPRG